ncbi:M24 family metallopeptidase [Candidatus Pelagibacter sp.]|jgi:Xaa-Pro dipeptidase/ectoine hydrolase|nr:M24 family metallopeptidase [Candidatus Pelagibacter sp.]MDC0855558.1 M24 family metallopeptidase [Candidatus Pelagibacter sp.]
MLFTKDEYKKRLKKVQIAMQDKGIELLISHDTANMNYLTGYDAWSFYYAQCVLVHVNADEPICFVRAQDAGGAYIKTYLKDENIIQYHEKYIHTWPLHPYDYLVETIKDRKWDKLNIGLEMDSHYFTAFCYEKIKQGLPNSKIKDSDRLVNWARLVKSEAEINLMKSAAIISQKGMKTAMEVINPGVRQCDAVGEIQKSLFYGTPEFGGEYSSIATLLPTGKGTSASHLTATQDKFVTGEATIVELSGVYKRYHVPMARTVLLGKAEQKKIDAMKATNEALDAGFSVVRAGNTADDVAQKFWGVLDKYNIKKDSRTGYSIGIGYPPDWGEQTLNISKGDKTVLQPNVTFHMIAVMQFGEWGVEASESVRVTENGHELFCNFSRDLNIK